MNAWDRDVTARSNIWTVSFPDAVCGSEAAAGEEPWPRAVDLICLWFPFETVSFTNASVFDFSECECSIESVRLFKDWLASPASLSLIWASFLLSAPDQLNVLYELWFPLICCTFHAAVNVTLSSSSSSSVYRMWLWGNWSVRENEALTSRCVRGFTHENNINAFKFKRFFQSTSLCFGWF